jgi:hypothetical protein
LAARGATALAATPARSARRDRAVMELLRRRFLRRVR